MPLFDYDALQAGGIRLEGQLRAASMADAKQELRQRGLLLRRITLKGLGRTRLNDAQVALLLRQLAFLTDAGLPLYEALVNLQEQYAGEALGTLLAGLCDLVHQGTPLSKAIQGQDPLLDDSVTTMLHAAEAGADQGLIFGRLAELFETRLALKNKLMQALLYPALLAAVTIAVVLLLLLFVVPSLEPLLTQLPSQRDSTRVLLYTSRLLRECPLEWLLGGAAMVTAVSYWLHRHPTLSWLYALPALGPLLLQAQLLKVTFVLHALLEASVPLVEALAIVLPLVIGTPLHHVFASAVEGVMQGKPLSTLLDHSLLPKLFPRLIHLGEESGQLAAALAQVERIARERLDRELTRLTSLAQPVILLVMGVVVGLVMAAILLPLTDVSRFQG